MPYDPVQALKSAAVLRSSPGVSNFDETIAPILENPYGPGHTPTAWEQESRERVLDQAFPQAKALGALRGAAENRRMVDSEDQAYRDADLESNGMHRLDMQNAFQDYNSERGANRQFLGNAAALHARDYGDHMHQLHEQFVRPAEIRGDSDIAVEDLRGGYGVDQARVRGAAQDHTQDIALKGLLDAAIAQIKTRGRLDPAMLHQLEQFAPQLGGGIQP